MMKATTLFLSRKNHDRLIDLNQPLLLACFAKCGHRSWTLAGVYFYDLPVEMAAEVKATLDL